MTKENKQIDEQTVFQMLRKELDQIFGSQ